MLTSTKGEINSNTIIMGDFNTLLTPMDRSTKQKIIKETQTLNDTMDQLDLIDIYRTFHPKTMNFTFFSSAHRTFSRIDHILGHKSSLGKFKKVESISPKVRSKTRVPTFTATIQQSSGSFGHSNQSRKRNKRNPNWKRRSKTFTVCRWHDPLHRKP